MAVVCSYSGTGSDRGIFNAYFVFGCVPGQMQPFFNPVVVRMPTSISYSILTVFFTCILHTLTTFLLLLHCPLLLMEKCATYGLRLGRHICPSFPFEQGQKTEKKKKILPFYIKIIRFVVHQPVYRVLVSALLPPLFSKPSRLHVSAERHAPSRGSFFFILLFSLTTRAS